MSVTSDSRRSLSLYEAPGASLTPASVSSAFRLRKYRSGSVLAGPGSDGAASELAVSVAATLSLPAKNARRRAPGGGPHLLPKTSTGHFTPCLLLYPTSFPRSYRNLDRVCTPSGARKHLCSVYMDPVFHARAFARSHRKAVYPPPLPNAQAVLIRPPDGNAFSPSPCHRPTRRR